MSNVESEMDIVSSSKNFAKVNWGPDEAKGDDHLLKYFVQFPNFSAIRDGRLRYVVGRKGSGKTAVIERLRLELRSDPLFFHSSLTLRDFPIQDFRDLRDRSFRDKAQFVAAWKFLIYIELARIICADEGAQPRDVVEELRQFIRDNGFADSIGFTSAVSILRKKDQKLKVSLRWIEGEKTTGDQIQDHRTLHFNKVSDLLGMVCTNRLPLRWAG